MSTIAFDTLKFVEKLEKAGISREHAKAEAEAIAEVLDKGSANLVTQNDIKTVQSEIKALDDRLNGKILLLQWMIGFSLALNTAILLKLMSH